MKRVREAASSASAVSSRAHTAAASRAHLALHRETAAKWDYELKRQPSQPAWRLTLAKILESSSYQVFVVIVLLVDFIQAMFLMVASSTGEDYDEVVEMDSQVTVAILSIVTCDVVLRMIAEGYRFFTTRLNIFELIVVVLCIVFEFVKVSIPVSLCRSLRPAFRAVRAFRMMSKAAIAKRRLVDHFDRMVDDMATLIIDRLLGHVLLLPPKNLDISASEGSIRLEKAQLVHEAFQGLHLPFTVKGGFVELFHVDFNLKGRDDGGVLVILRNMLVVVGPGHHQLPPETPWTYDAVLEAKNRLVELIARFVEVTQEKPQMTEEEQAEMARRAKRKKKKASIGARYAKKVREHLLGGLHKNIHVEVRNIVVQYEDPQAELGGGKVIGGFKLGRLNAALAGMEHWKDPDGEGHEFRATGKRRQSEREVDQPQQRVTSQGEVRLNILFQRLSAWWDLDPTASFLGPLLQDKQQIAKAIRSHAFSELRQCIRVASLHEMMRKYEQCHSRMFPIAKLSKLQQMFANHQYLLQPASVSMHVRLCEPESGSSGSQAHVVTHDVDVLIKNLTFEAGIRRVASMKKLMAYKKQWECEDKSFMWRPALSPCSECWCDPDASEADQRKAKREHIQAWWRFALQGALRWADPKENWQTLSKLELYRRSSIRKLYFELMHERFASAVEEAAKQAGKRRISQRRPSLESSWDALKERAMQEIQVALPLPELLQYRKLARKMEATSRSRAQRESGFARQNTQSLARCGSLREEAQQAVAAHVQGVKEHVQEVKEQASVHMEQVADWPSKQSEVSLQIDEEKPKGAMQVSVRLERAVGVILEMPIAYSSGLAAHDATPASPGNVKEKKHRRPAVQLINHQLTISFCKDPPIGPLQSDSDSARQKAKRRKGTPAPCRMKLDVSLGRFSQMFCQAPSTVPFLRHMVWPQLPRGANLGPMFSMTLECTPEPTPQWVMKLDVAALKVVLYKPLLTALAKGLETARLPTAAPAAAGIALVAKDLIHPEERSRRRGFHAFRAATKRRLPGGGGATITLGTITSGGLEVLMVQPISRACYSQTRYLQLYFNLPTITQEIAQEAGSATPHVKAACLLSVPSSGTDKSEAPGGQMQLVNPQECEEPALPRIISVADQGFMDEEDETLPPPAAPQVSSKSHNWDPLVESDSCCAQFASSKMFASPQRADRVDTQRISNLPREGSGRTWLERLLKSVVCDCSCTHSCRDKSKEAETTSALLNPEHVCHVLPWEEKLSEVDPIPFIGTMLELVESSPGNVTVEIVHANTLGLHNGFSRGPTQRAPGSEASASRSFDARRLIVL